MSTPATTSQDTFDGFSEAEQKAIVDEYLAAMAKKDGYMDIGCAKDSVGGNAVVGLGVTVAILVILMIVIVVLYKMNHSELKKYKTKLSSPTPLTTSSTM